MAGGGVRTGVKRALLVTCAMAVLLVAGAAAWLRWAPRQVPAGQPSLVTLDTDWLPGFRAAFNGSRGEVRVLVLLSPT